MNSYGTVIGQLELQTKLFENSTVGFSEDDAARVHGAANHVKWIAGHTVSSRYMMANVLGLAEEQPFPDLFANGKGRQDEVKYPSMSDLTRDWSAISAKVVARLKSMSDADLSAPSPFPHPMTDGKLSGLIGFLTHHEAYSIGQLGYARRIAGMDAMKYD